jgi:protocatechuate 3,4-dioxygenase beta subunit
VRGGVITGKVTDEQGHPVVEERVNLLVVLDPKRGGSYRGHTVATDDRGIYRIFGIRPGQYKVLISMEGNYYSGRGRPQHRTTFYPDATDVNQATIIEVRESAEVTKIDFTVAALPEGHAASGRVLDETGQPVPNALISLSQITVMDPNSTTSYGMNSGVHSDKQGEFRIEDLAPGKYSISVSLPPESDMRPESMTFDLVDADVTGLVIKTSRGGSVAGTLVIEGGKAADLMANLTDTFMEVNLSHPETRDSSGRSVPIGRDGSFRVGGLDAGIVRLSVESPAGFTLARIERDGVTQPNSIPLRKGEHIDGIRVVLVRHTGSVRGVIKLENGVLPANGRFIVQVIKVDNRNERSSSAQVDLRGHFVVEGLGDGNYELMVFLYVPGSPKSFPSAKQIISVTDGAVTEVTLTVDLAVPFIR